MEHLLRDPMWQFVGVMIGAIALIAAIVIPLFVARRQRQNKALEYRILTSTSIFNPAAHGNLELLFKKQQVKDVQLVILQIINSGNMEINPADYHERVTVEFSPHSRILNAEITSTSPAELSTDTDIRDNRMFFAPTLLNAGDWFTIKFLVASFKEGIKVHGRISGVKQISEHVNRSNAVSWFLLACALLLYCFGFFTIYSNAPRWMTILCVCLALCVAGGMAYNLFKAKQEAKLFRSALRSTRN